MHNSLLYLCCPQAERRLTDQRLRSAGLTPRWADDVADALRALAERESVVLADFADPRVVEVVTEIRRRRPSTILLAISESARPGVQDEIARVGIPVVLSRPLDPRALALLSARPSSTHASSVPAAAGGQGATIFAQSPAMRAALQAVEHALAQGGGVLLCGEPGTGRHLLAREIHARGAGPSAPFVRVDAGEATGDQLELALFGTLDGDPGGAGDLRRAERIADRCALAQAQGGTLFIAHLADAPARTQSRLARVFRDGEVVVSDRRRATPIDIRPIASADPSWDLAVAEGGIRLDLARRMSITRVEVPPLRSRREDIPQLAACLLHAACVEHRALPKTIEPSAVAVLTALPWHRNGHELRDLLETLVLRVAGTVLCLEDVLAAIDLDASARTLPSGTLREARARFEREYITAVLDHHRGRIGEAARALGIQRTNLYRKLRSLKVSWRRPAGGNGASTGRGPEPGGHGV